MARRSLVAVSTPDALVNSLRERILNGELAPGATLPETVLASEYGVARPTIRSALQQLATTGLVLKEPNRSALIPTMSAADQLDLYRARELVESEVVRRLANRRHVPEESERAVRRLESLAAGTVWSETIEADLDVHRSLAEGVGSPRLARMFGMLEDEIRLSSVQLMRAPYESPVSLAADLRKLLTLIEQGAMRPAVNVLRDHIAPLRSADLRKIPPRSRRRAGEDDATG